MINVAWLVGGAELGWTGPPRLAGTWISANEARRPEVSGPDDPAPEGITASSPAGAGR